MRFAFSLVVLTWAASGCAMCDNPYDYCSPVVAGGYSDRAGTYSQGFAEESVGPIEMQPDEYSMTEAPRPASPRMAAKPSGFRGR